MIERQTSPVLIELSPKGTVSFLGFRDTPLLAAVAEGRGRYASPFLIRGVDAEPELASLDHLERKTKWLRIGAIDDLPNRILVEPAADVIRRQGNRYHGFMAQSHRDRLVNVLDGPSSPDSVMEFCRGLMDTGQLSDSAARFVQGLRDILNRTGVILDYADYDRFFALVLIATWMTADRRYPLVLHGVGRMPFDSALFAHFAANVAKFDDLVQESNRVLGTPTEEIEKAYRVWQISRKAGDAKAKATTPAHITIPVAKSFLRVLTRARTEREARRVAPQRPAPLMFDFGADAIGLKHGVSSDDPAAYTAAAASSLMRQLERLAADHSLSNSVPSAGGIIEVGLEILVKVRAGDYTDADIIELGMDFNSLQWHIDFVRQQIGDATQGELAGLFSSFQIFLARFKCWREFELSPNTKAVADPESVGLAVTLLQGARGSKKLLNAEAATKVERVLDRAASTGEPSQQEGIVRSGENLAAIAVESLSQIAVERANSRVEPDVHDDAIIRYMHDNKATLQKLAQRRNWPWLIWLNSVLP